MFATYDDYKAAGTLFDYDYAYIPEDMRDAMIRYVEDRIPPGHFLTAVITNNLVDAVGRADARNLTLLKQYVQWFYNVAPSACYGSVQKMKSWVEAKNEV